MAATVRSLFSDLRDRITPPTHTSTFLTTGKLTPEEFISAGDYLVYKFPTWSWSPAAPGKSKTYLPLDKQFLVTKGVPCHRRLDDNFAGSAGLNDRVVESGDSGAPGEGIDGDEEGWLSTGVTKNEEESASTAKDVRTVDDKGRVEEENDDSESIGDMEDEEDDSEAIIRDGDNTKTPLRTYTLYITYSTYYSTPRLYLTGKHGSTSSPLTHAEMMQDIVGDYQDKTVTIEEFPFLEGNLKMPSVHPCKHASVMRLLLDRANAAAKAKKRREAEAESSGGGESREEKEWEEIDYSKTLAEAKEEESDQQGKAEGKAGNPDDEAIRADQYLVVFLKFMASVTPGIEHDYTMGL